MTIEIIKANIDKSWNQKYISGNPNITCEIIQDNPDKPWYWMLVSNNNMSKEKERWINQHRLEYIKALQIQRHWRNCSCNPEFKLSQRILSRLYES